MTHEFKKVALVGHYTDSRVAEPMQSIAAYLAKAGCEVLAPEGLAEELGSAPVTEAEVAANADLVVAVGGDGTILHAASIVVGTEVPLLGINRGRLGFLTDVSPADMEDSFDRIFSGDYTRESRMRLRATLNSADGTRRSALALNDVVLQRRDTGRMLDFETRIAGLYVNTHRGDGLIVSTPTGSTAYALSCGGPIISPDLDAVVVVPICPHTLSDRPLVIPAKQQIEVALLARDDTNAEVSVDGHSLGDLNPGDHLTIAESNDRVTLIHPPGYDYFEILRSKLNWGRDNRNERRSS
jgi:NAD+ kinase